MKNEHLIQFKKQLEEEKKEIEEQLKKLEKMPDFGNDIDSLEEEADETEEYGNQMAVAHTFKKRLADIETALEKIKNNNYGICEKCGKEISLELLKVDPESRLCQDCKKRP